MIYAIKKSPSGEATKLLARPHFWIIAAITLFLIFIYQAWPWREWYFSGDVLKWFSWLSHLYGLALFESRYHLIGILCLLPIIYASIIFLWRGSLIITLISLAGLLPTLIRLRVDFDTGLTNISLMLLPIAILLVVKIELELRRKDKLFFIEREKERQMYLMKILEAQEKERRRLAEELHDQSVQTLLAVASYAESIASFDDDNVSEMKKKAALIRGETRNVVKDLRRISIDLRPSVLDQMGLVAALKWLTNRINKEHHIAIQLTINDFEHELDPSVEVNLFRIAQEAMQNIVRHSKASQAFITLEEDTESLRMTIWDNGQGFITPDNVSNLVADDKLGLIGIQERVRSLDGMFQISSEPGEGTLLSIEIPTSK